MIRVNENYCIDVDDNCYTVKIDKHKENKKGNPVFEVVGYYGSLASAVKGVIESMNRRKLNDGILTLEKAVEIVIENNNQFTEMLERAVKCGG